jgi:hypothetical protein
MIILIISHFSLPWVLFPDWAAMAVRKLRYPKNEGFPAAAWIASYMTRGEFVGCEMLRCAGNDRRMRIWRKGGVT